MKLSKKVKTQVITNPFRVPKPFTTSEKRCRIIVGSTFLEGEYYEVVVDADEVKNFWAKIETIPYPEKMDDGILEVWHFTKKHLPNIKKWAIKYFDVVMFEDIDKTVTRLK